MHQIIRSATARQVNGATQNFNLQLDQRQLSRTASLASPKTLTYRLYKIHAPLWRNYDFAYTLYRKQHTVESWSYAYYMASPPHPLLQSSQSAEEYVKDTEMNCLGVAWNIS
jgi:hypothetical protein